MHGKVVVVTGSNVGIGKETALGLAARGATTVLACRNPTKAAAAAAEIRQRTENDDVHVVPLDLADPGSVRSCAATILNRWSRLDVLVNNAGGIWSHREITEQGFEQTFGVNHLGPFYLTNLLLDRMLASAPARVVNLASFGHHFAVGGMRWSDLQTEHGYTAMRAYSQSKLANVLFTRALAGRVDPSRLTANAMHPGLVRSGFGMDGDMTGLTGWGNRVLRAFEVPPWVGAKTAIFLASDPRPANRTGLYWVRKRPGHMSHAAKNDTAADRLWGESEQLLASVGYALPAGVRLAGAPIRPTRAQPRLGRE